MAISEITGLASNVRLLKGDELAPGDIVQTISRFFSFSLGLVIHRSHGESGPVIAPLDGDHSLAFWPHQKDVCFLKLVASSELAVRFDPAELGDHSPYRPGTLTVMADGSFLCLRSSRNGMPAPQLLSLSSWDFMQPRLEDGRFAAYSSCSLGRLSEDGVFRAVATILAR